MIRKLAAGAFAVTTLAVTAPIAAHAEPVDDFSVCVDTCDWSADGSITWHNRTATVAGKVLDTGSGSTQVQFRAYAADRQIGSTQTRTIDDADPSKPNPLPYRFVMGDSNLKGGIDKITVVVCHSPWCTNPTSYLK